ncbi:MAG TPA: hypothetical protein VGH08_09805 [Chthoniobacterales bacterium]
MTSAAIIGATAVGGCATADKEPASEPANASATAVPGEVDPNAPSASQQVRTTPGFNF